MITQTKITKWELRDILADRLGVSGLIVVARCPQRGWRATLITYHAQMVNAPAMLEQIVRELLPYYVLID